MKLKGIQISAIATKMGPLAGQMDPCILESLLTIASPMLMSQLWCYQDSTYHRSTLVCNIYVAEYNLYLQGHLFQ